MANPSTEASRSSQLSSGVACQRCINPKCGATFDVGQTRTACDHCGDLLDIQYDWSRIEVPKRLSDFEQMWSHRHQPLRFSGVWRFHELLSFAPANALVTVGEGRLCCSRPIASVGTWAPSRGNCFCSMRA